MTDSETRPPAQDFSSRNLKRDTFTRDKFRWLEQIAGDPAVPNYAVRVALGLTFFLNRRDGCSWPAQPTLAKRISISRRAVQNGIYELEKHGHLRIEFGHGPGDSNHYFPIIKNAHASAHQSDKEVDEAAHGSAHEERAAECAHSDGEYAQPAPAGAQPAPAGAQPSAHNTNEEPLDEPIEEIDSPPPDLAEEDLTTSLESSFEEWWRMYPRHVAKRRAREVYEGIVEKGKATTAELLAGAMRYAAERDGQDPRYTKHPTTWLRGGCWTDEPAPVAGAVIDQNGALVAPGPAPGRRPSHLERALAGGGAR
jgi:hypothetical protein